MARQIRLPYQEPPTALEERVHHLEGRVELLVQAVRILARERPGVDDAALRELEPLIAGDDGRARNGR